MTCNCMNDLEVQEGQRQWIPVSERMPELGADVQITTIRREVLHAILQSDADWYLVNWDQFVDYDYAEAWRPFPQKDDE